MTSGMAELQAAYRDSSEERGKAMGLATTGIVFGVCLGPLFGGGLHEVEYWLPYAALALAELLLLAIVLWAHYRGVPGTGAAAAADNSGSEAQSGAAIASEILSESSGEEEDEVKSLTLLRSPLVFLPLWGILWDV